METHACRLGPLHVKKIQTVVFNSNVLVGFGRVCLSRELPRVQWESHGGCSAPIGISYNIIESEVKTRRPGRTGSTGRWDRGEGKDCLSNHNCMTSYSSTAKEMLSL